MTTGKTIEVSDLSDSIRKKSPSPAEGEDLLEGESLKEATLRFERVFIENRLTRNDGNISKTAEQIGIARRNLHRKIRQLGIRIERQGEA